MLCALILISIIIGAKRNTAIVQTTGTEKNKNAYKFIPYIGRIEVLNGCGEVKAANQIADFLRSKNFDVKNIGNAVSWNYPFTIVISRTTDMAIAQNVSRTLHTDKLILLRTGDTQYNVSIIVGADYKELIQ